MNRNFMDEMQQKKISVILPVYNCEETVARAIHAILNQTYQNLELLIVEDGSTDGTLAVCQSFKDVRIRIIQQENGGVSRARNVGMAQATGTYLQFADGDDYMEPALSETLVEIMEQHNEMAVCNYVCFDGTEETRYREVSGRLKRNVYLDLLMDDPGSTYFGVVWNKLYRRNLVQENHLQFEESVALGEDFIFNLQYLKYCNYLTVTEQELYHYMQVSELSLTKKKKPFEKQVEERSLLLRRLKEFLEEEHRIRENGFQLRHYCRKSAIIEYETILFYEKNMTTKEKQRRIRLVDENYLHCFGYKSRRQKLIMYVAAFKYRYFGWLRVRKLRIAARQLWVKNGQ